MTGLPAELARWAPLRGVSCRRAAPRRRRGTTWRTSAAWWAPPPRLPQPKTPTCGWWCRPPGCTTAWPCRKLARPRARAYADAAAGFLRGAGYPEAYLPGIRHAIEAHSFWRGSRRTPEARVAGCRPARRDWRDRRGALPDAQRADRPPPLRSRRALPAGPPARRPDQRRGSFLCEAAGPGCHHEPPPAAPKASAARNSCATFLSSLRAKSPPGGMEGL